LVPEETLGLKDLRGLLVSWEFKALLVILEKMVCLDPLEKEENWDYQDPLDSQDSWDK